MLVLIPWVLTAQGGPRDEAQRLLLESQDLIRQQRYAEALTRLDTVATLAPDLAEVFNLRGSLYLTPDLRDFDKAQAQLDKAVALQPSSPAPRLNQAELLFVKQDWAAASAYIRRLLEKYPKLKTPVKHLMLYKQVICEVKLGAFDQAEKTQKAHFHFMDHTPAYYYSHAAVAFSRQDDKSAQEWLRRAREIYSPKDSFAYLDALTEAGWVAKAEAPASQK